MKPGQRRRCRSSLERQAGFTLIELLVVMVILGLLVALVAPRLFGKLGQSKLGAAQAQIELLRQQNEMIRLLEELAQRGQRTR